MARAAKILHNLNSVSEMVGALEGMMEGMNTDRYLNTIMREAHAEETKTFDLATAAHAKSNRLISHVYEYGVPGITRGEPKFSDPTSKAARLYQHKASGGGRRIDAYYVFRPAVNRNPVPDTEITDVDQGVLDKLHNHKYVFYNKAFVMETGQRVDVTPTNHDMIFVPSTENFKARDSDGSVMPFIFTNFASPRPGKQRKGKFNQWWMSYWSGPGAANMQQHIEDRVETDVMENVNSELAIANMNAGKLTVPNPRQSFSAYNKGRNRSKRAMEFAIHRGRMNGNRIEVEW